MPGRRGPCRRQQVVRADKDDAEGNGGLDDARRRVDDLQRRQRQRDAVADRESRDDRQQAPEAAAKQQQADDEEDVVGPDGDVVNARGREGLEHREETLTGAAVQIDARLAAVENFLPNQLAAFVDVDEGLMIRDRRERDRRRW